MPCYELICPKCESEYEIHCKISEYDEKIKKAACDNCENIQLKRHFKTPPNMTIPGNMTYNGQTKALVGAAPYKKGKEESRVPINIIDENPDGSIKLTRIGSKADIENE